MNQTGAGPIIAGAGPIIAGAGSFITGRQASPQEMTYVVDYSATVSSAPGGMTTRTRPRAGIAGAAGATFMDLETRTTRMLAPISFCGWFAAASAWTPNPFGTNSETGQADTQSTPHRLRSPGAGKKQQCRAQWPPGVPSYSRE
jgi:hypothetical protein